MKSGFSLIEVLMATAVLGIITVALVPFFKSINNVNQTTEINQESTLLVKAFVEELYDSWSTPVNFDDDSFADGSKVQDKVLTSQYSSLKCNINVINPDIGIYDKAIRKRVKITCTAKDSSRSDFVLELGRPL